MVLTVLSLLLLAQLLAEVLNAFAERVHGFGLAVECVGQFTRLQIVTGLAHVALSTAQRFLGLLARWTDAVGELTLQLIQKLAQRLLLLA